MLHCRGEEHDTLAIEMLAVANSEVRLDDLRQHRPALDQVLLSQVLAVQVKQIEGI